VWRPGLRTNSGLRGSTSLGELLRASDSGAGSCRRGRRSLRHDLDRGAWRSEGRIDGGRRDRLACLRGGKLRAPFALCLLGAAEFKDRAIGRLVPGGLVMPAIDLIRELRHVPLGDANLLLTAAESSPKHSPRLDEWSDLSQAAQQGLGHPGSAEGACDEDDAGRHVHEQRRLFKTERVGPDDDERTSEQTVDHEEEEEELAALRRQVRRGALLLTVLYDHPGQEGRQERRSDGDEGAGRIRDAKVAEKHGQAECLDGDTEHDGKPKQPRVRVVGDLILAALHVSAEFVDLVPSREHVLVWSVPRVVEGVERPLEAVALGEMRVTEVDVCCGVLCRSALDGLEKHDVPPSVTGWT